MQVTVGPKYQVVIPKEIRKKIKGLVPGRRVTVYFENEDTLTVKTTPHDWVARTKGMMTEAWKDINTNQELKKIRNEWEERLKEFEAEK